MQSNTFVVNVPTVRVTEEIVKWRVRPQFTPDVLEVVETFFNEHLGVDDTDEWLAACVADLAEFISKKGYSEDDRHKMRALSQSVRFLTRLRAVCDVSHNVDLEGGDEE